MSEIVKYSNELNKVPLTNFTEMDLNFFYTICSRVRNRNDDLIVLDFEDIKRISNYKPTSNERFIRELNAMSKKLIRCSSRFETDTEIVFMTMFQMFKIDKDKLELHVQINKNFVPYFNNLVDEFTSFELQQYVSLGGVHSKALYRVLKQWKTQGITPKYSVEQIKAWLDIPNYKPRDIMQKALLPAIEEISKKRAFSNLWVEVIYSKKRGKPVDGYVFHFGKEDIQGQMYFGDSSSDKPTKRTTSKNKFTLFEQNSYDFNALEDKLLNS